METTAQTFYNPLAGGRWEGLFSDPTLLNQHIIVDGITVKRIGVGIPIPEALLTQSIEYLNDASQRFSGSKYYAYEFELSIGKFSINVKTPSRLNDMVSPYSSCYLGTISYSLMTSSELLQYGKLLVAAAEIASVFDFQVEQFKHTLTYKKAIVKRDEEIRYSNQEAERFRALERDQEEKKKIDDLAKGAGKCQRTVTKKSGNHKGITTPCDKIAKNHFNGKWYCGTVRSGCYCIMRKREGLEPEDI